MNWTEPRKSEKYSEQALSACKKIETTCINTPIFDKDYKPIKNEPQPVPSNQPSPKNCPYHFNFQDHVCLTCRKSICVRCAITYCQDHFIKQEKDIIPTLMEDLRKIYIKEKIDEVETKLGQSLQRQDYFQNKMIKLVEKIQSNFNSVIEALNEKKMQIMSYFDLEFQSCFSEYHEYDELLKNKLIWLNKVDRECINFMRELSLQYEKFTIEKIDELTENVKNDVMINGMERKLSEIFLGKSKFTINKIWSEEILEKVLYEIEKIPYKLNKDLSIPHVKVIEKNKRIVTEIEESGNKMQSSINKSPPEKKVKASGRMIYNKFNSGRKNKEEKLEKSEFI